MRLIKSMGPAFNRDLREYIVPEVLDAYLAADQEALNARCGEVVRIFYLHSSAHQLL